MYVEYCGAPQRKGKGDNTMKKAAFILALAMLLWALPAAAASLYVNTK